MADAIQLLLPPGRIVWGSLYRPNDKDMEGRPLMAKDNITPRVEYVFGVAIPKVPGEHWAKSAWGAQLWALGHKRLSNAGALGSNYSWKVTDGDSAEIRPPATVAPKDKPGHPGHWILKLSGGFAPKVYRLDPNTQKPALWLEPDAVMPGDWIEPYVSVTDNMNTTKPGIYLNHSMVCFVGYDVNGRIVTGPDAGAVGFGAAARPAAASATPLSVLAPSVATPPAPSASPAPAAPPAVPAGPPSTPPAPVSIEPHVGILTPPAADVPPPPAARAMSAKAQGASYEALIAKGWTDALLTEHGMFA